jgi:hypothetical protein
VAAEDWLSKSDAMDIGRIKHSKLSDDVLWQKLRDHAPGFPLETKPRPSNDGTQEIVKVVEPSSDGLEVRWKMVAAGHFGVPLFFRHDVKKLFNSIGKSKSTPKPIKRRLPTEQKRELITFFQGEARTKGRLLTDKEVLEIADQRGVTVRQARLAAKAAKVVTSERGRPRKNSRTRSLT